MKKTYIIIVCIALIGIIWLFPAKMMLHSTEKYISKHLTDGKTILVCHVDQITGPLWKIKTSYGNLVDKNPEYVNVTGNVPDDYLKYPMYSYDADFLFLGTFDEEISELFIVEEWEVCSWITRGGTYRHPFYPPYGFNLFEIKWP